ncbi:MAG: alpha/beta fold hydrolase [Acidimicrobiales bacterium]|jgi:pimeloyl-ACP methyl ester carboxylesterase|nr:alpha/beta fold hydrolase [Acidimicrobiales bacterium]
MATRPSRLLAALEIRALGEMGSFALSAPALAALLPKGTPKTVLVLPGFLADDASTAPMRRLLGHLGHDVHGWDLGRNIGPTNEIMDGLVERVEELDRRGGPLDIIGWSLGGIYAREIARLAPSVVRQVVTMASPFQTTGPDESNASAAFRALRARHNPEFELNRVPSWAREPIPVWTTSIYTKTDGIVHWSQCLNVHRPHTENIEVRGSHCGLGYNPFAMWIVADRLAQPANEWNRFRPPGPLRYLFPRGTGFDVAAA